ncbi:MAG: amino acid ABC transporter permease [Candidatus Eremiobacteraeota bacterium]|nr:amino acid ABC transporter permease [Candidatus Eremiobacteraeota bacterium]
MHIRLTFMYDMGERARMLHGFEMTVWLSIVTIAASTVIGVIGVWLLGAHSVAVRRAVDGYVQFFRNTPPLVQLYFFFFALSPLLSVHVAGGGSRPMLGNLFWAAFSLSLFAGAFNVEIFRSGIEAIPRTTLEAAESLGFSRLQTFATIVFPLAFRIGLPAFTNNVVNLVKTTSLAYAIAVPEMLYSASQIWSDDLNVPEMMSFILVAYIALVAIVVWTMEWLERRLRIPGYGM